MALMPVLVKTLQSPEVKLARFALRLAGRSLDVMGDGVAL